MPGDHNLLDLCLGGNDMGLKGCRALGELMINSSCKIQNLDLRCNQIDDECIDILNGILAAENTALRTLNLSDQPLVTPTGWSNFSSNLSSPRCLLVKLWLLDNQLGDEFSTHLGGALKVNDTLTELDLHGCSVNDKQAARIFTALAVNSTLTKLCMSSNKSITSPGWATCFGMLRDSQSSLEVIDVSQNTIGALGASELVGVLASSMRTVWSVDLQESVSVTNTEWRSFAKVLLPSSTCKLKELRLGSDMFAGTDRIGDDVIKRFARDLRNNTCLKVLELNRTNISRSGWNVLSNALFDTSTMTSTFCSNHTLQEVFSDSDVTPKDLYCWLETNGKYEDKAQLARTRIIDHHLPDINTSVDIFGSMPRVMVPYALSWIGRDRHEFRMMNHLLRKMPWIL